MSMERYILKSMFLKRVLWKSKWRVLMENDKGLIRIDRQNMNPRQSMQTYYGYAFESYCTADTPRRPAPDPTCRDPFGWSGDVNNNVQWCSVVRTKLGNTRIFIGGEVDCVRGKFDFFLAGQQ